MIPIFAPLEPYLFWIKVGIVAVVVGGAAAGGWTVRGWRCDAAKTQEVQQMLVDADEDRKDYLSRSALEQAFRDNQRNRYTTEISGLRATNAGLEERIKNANLNQVTPRDGESLRADEPFNVAFLRAWNDPIIALHQIGGGPEAGVELLGADTRAVRVTREDVLQHHRKIVGLYGDCKVKQNYVIEWDRQWRPYMGVK